MGILLLETCLCRYSEGDVEEKASADPIVVVPCRFDHGSFLAKSRNTSKQRPDHVFWLRIAAVIVGRLDDQEDCPRGRSTRTIQPTATGAELALANNDDDRVAMGSV